MNWGSFILQEIVPYYELVHNVRNGGKKCLEVVAPRADNSFLSPKGWRQLPIVFLPVLCSTSSKYECFLFHVTCCCILF